MNKTKMIATIGPSSKDKEIIKNMIIKGVDVIRINMSHSTFEEAREIILDVRNIDREINTVTGIMLDTRGPEIRVGDLKEDKIKVEEGSTLRISKTPIKGTSDMISLTLPAVIDYIKIGQNILLNDGNVLVEVASKTNDMLICDVKNDGEIKEHCSVNIPEAEFNLKFLSPILNSLLNLFNESPKLSTIK